jgi:hypothetical protein
MKLSHIFFLMTILTSLLRAQQSPNPQDTLSRVSIDPNGWTSGSPDDVRAIHRLSKKLFVHPMGDFKALSAEHQKILIFAANESFEVDAYLEMLALVLKEVADGNVSPDVGSVALIPWRESKEGVLSVNHTDPRIAEVLPRLLAQYPDNSEVSDYVRKLISGEAKQEHVKLFESEGRKPAHMIAKVPSRGSNSSSLINAADIPKKSLEAKSISPAQTEGSSSTFSWSFMALLIAGSIALLWLALKRRP